MCARQPQADAESVKSFGTQEQFGMPTSSVCPCSAWWRHARNPAASAFQSHKNRTETRQTNVSAPKQRLRWLFRQ